MTTEASGSDPRAAAPAARRHPERACPSPDVVLNVDPTLSRTGEHCFATLRDAVGMARKFRSDSSASRVRIRLTGGRHVVRDTLELGAEDSGSEECPFIIEGDDERQTVISGGCRLNGFLPAADVAGAERLSEESRDRVWVCDLRNHGIDNDWGELTPRFGCGGTSPSGRKTWPEVYYNGNPLALTRWPLDNYAHVGKVSQGEHTKNGIRYDTPGVFTVAEGVDLTKWRKSFEAGDVWTSGMWAWLWNCEILPVKHVDYVSGTVHHGLPAPFGLRSKKPFYFINMLEELKYPGQYYVDRKAAVLYLIPPDGEPDPCESVVEVSTVSEPFVRAENASHVIFRNLAFEYHQADAVTVKGGKGFALEGCRLARVSGNAIKISGGHDHRVLHCHLHTLGAGGIDLDAGDRRILAPGNCLIENCRIHDFARINRAYAPAISVGGCGNRVRHCEIFNSPHHGVRVGGDNHLVELCSFHHLVLEFDDQAPLEMFGNPYYRGNRFRWNSFHHVGGGQTQEGQAGIRLDDFISAVEIYGNVFYAVGRGTFGAVQLHGGKDNRVEGNLFIECQAMVSFSPWGEERWLKSLKSWTFTNKDAELTEPRVAAYPELLEVETNYDRNFILGNVSLGCRSLALDDAGRNIYEHNVTRAACPDWPMGTDGLPEVDFEDPVFKDLAFAPIPMANIGCYENDGTGQRAAQ